MQSSAMPAGIHNIHGKTHGLWTQSPLSLTQAETERFWSKVQRTADDGCWLWMASVTGSGSVKHGQFKVRRGRGQLTIKPHRLVWEQTHGSIPSGLCVCHHCDEPRCCNPAHLFLGTQQDNLNDARRKGRLIDGLHKRKLSDADYQHILTSRERGVDLARRYGVTDVTISRIRAGCQGRATFGRQSILEDQARKPQPGLTAFNVSHQLEQPLSLGKAR